MKQGIHPEYMVATVVCACGNRFETMSTQEELHVEICAVCHPFYTGKQRLVDTAGRVDRFKRKYQQQSDSTATSEAAEAAEPEAAEADAAQPEADEPEAAATDGADEAETAEAETAS